MRVYTVTDKPNVNKIRSAGQALARRTFLHTHIYFQWLFQPIQGPGLLFSSVIILHRR
jgi:hypothetical protein